MSAPASLTPVKFNNLSAISSTPQGAALLKITPESLRKGGFDSLSWINYLNNVVLPQCIAAKNTFIETIAEPNNARSEKANLQTAKVKHLEIVAILKEIKFTIKDWKKTDGVLLTCAFKLEELMSCMDPVFADHLEITQVVRHLQHLLLEKASLSPEINPGGGFAFHLPPNESIVNLGAYRFGSIWKIKLMPSAAEFKMIPLFWSTPRSDFPDHAVLFSKDNTKLNAPFISVIFQPHPHDPIYNLKINENAPFTKKEVEKLTFVVDVIYCNGAEVDETRGNAILYKGTCVGGKCTNFACEDQKLNRFTDYVNKSSNIIIQEWLDEISQNSSLLQLHQIRTFTLPISEEETDERILGALELALESPEENGYIIEFIAQEQNFAFEPEEIAEAKQLALEPAIIRDGEEKETEDVSLSAKAMAHAMIQKIRKKNKSLAQQPKAREIKPAKAAASYKPPVMSKEEAKALLKKSAMPNDLREKSLNLLDGERLKSKREEDKFFLDMLAHQAKSSDSSVQKASSHGSHHSFKLVKQTDSGGKITFRAATLVNKHGSDANRGNSLGVQQSKLRQLLSPLSQQ